MPRFTRPSDAIRAPCVVQPLPTSKAASRLSACWRMKQCDCPAGRPGRVSARQPTYLFCFAKRRRREKATPEMAVRCADFPRRWHRNREASETRCAQTADASLSDFGTGDVSPSNGDSLQRPLHKQRQRQLSLRGTSNATATVAARARATATHAAQRGPMPRSLSPC